MCLNLGLGLGLDHWSFIWSEHSIKSMSCSKFQIRVNSAKPYTSKFNHYIKTWLRLTYYMNLAENQGFLVQFLALNVLICYTWRFH